MDFRLVILIPLGIILAGVLGSRLMGPLVPGFSARWWRLDSSLRTLLTALAWAALLVPPAAIFILGKVWGIGVPFHLMLGIALAGVVMLILIARATEETD
ncbi:MAG TPA: hypothetical protein VMU38_00040 [Candidatus Binatia bacterium]|nr:hypothetical protein [Candidatus Binatia bacterium]